MPEKSTGYAERIVCLTEETTETLYLLGEEWRIVGISGFTVRPKRARQEKPKVSTFLDAKIDEILDLKPDLVLGFSDIQAQIAADLVKAGVEVHIFNQRSVAEILKMMRMLGAMIGQSSKAEALAQNYEEALSRTRIQSSSRSKRPRVYFEEWYDPLICGIQWVSELIEIAGGENIFAEEARSSLAKGRILADHSEVVRRNPDIIIGSWCGKGFKKEQVVARKGWQEIKAVQDAQLHEIKSSIILQPGPAALTEGLDQLREIIGNWPG